MLTVVRTGLNVRCCGNSCFYISHTLYMGMTSKINVTVHRSTFQYNNEQNYFQLQDMGTGHVFVNNFQVLYGTAVGLSDGDVIRLGSCNEQSIEYRLQILPIVTQVNVLKIT